MLGTLYPYNMLQIFFAGKFASLTEKYKELLLHSSIEPVREELSELQTVYRECRVDPHPKLREIMNTVRNWKKSQRKSCGEKVCIYMYISHLLS